MKVLVKSLGELDRSAKRRAREMERVFEYDVDRRCLVLKIAYPYLIELRRIRSKADLLAWVSHLAGKPWMKRAHFREFIRRVGELKHWTFTVPS